MKSVICAIAAACAFACWSQDASATIVTFNYTGVITLGEDVSGVFGTPFANLAGDRVRLSFTFDDSVGYRGSLLGATDALYGGASTSYPATPSQGVKITIKGQTATIGGDYLGAVLNYAGSSNTSASFEDAANGAIVTVDSLATPASIDTPFKPYGRGAGQFDIETAGVQGQTESAFALISLGAPEPAAWLLMVLGFGALGGALRRRNEPRQLTAA